MHRPPKAPPARKYSEYPSNPRPHICFWQSDNGGDSGAAGQGMNNFPLRGTKWTHWEGGVNVVAFISGPLVPDSSRGIHYTGMLHSTDWRVTFAGLAQIDPDNSGPFPLDGHDVWAAVTANAPSPRNEVVHQVLKSPIVNQSCHPVRRDPPLVFSATFDCQVCSRTLVTG